MREGITVQVTLEMGPEKKNSIFINENGEKNKTDKKKSITKAWMQKTMDFIQASLGDSVS